MSMFSRSVAPFLRTSQAALRHQQHRASPLQQAWARGRNGAQFYNACRGMATVFERKKPHVNIGEIFNTYLGVGSMSS